MDPTTTLFTFMLQTPPSVQAVHLVGSWDNFAKAYAMERDSRRDRGQWRGCHSFKDITCDGDGDAGTNITKRNGGLKMGHTYYYYYELDGASETHDPSLPSTNTCPYLPGQTVNTLWVPVEQTSRKRSASLNSARDEDYMTMNPSDKFITPRPAPPVPAAAEMPRRVGSAPLRLQQQHKRSARSLSPASSWTFSPRKLFSRKASSSSLREAAAAPVTVVVEEERSGSSCSDGIRSRDISPESLRRFLCDDVVLEEESSDLVSSDRPAIAIPEDIVEENEDDDNFATSAVSETMAFTGLSPPPTQRSRSPTPVPTAVPLLPLSTPINVPAPPTRSAPPVPRPQLEVPLSVSFGGLQSRFSMSDSSFFELNSPQSPDSNSLPSFYHSDNEDDEDDEEDLMPSKEPASPHEPSAAASGKAFAHNLNPALSTYTLPQSSGAQEVRKLSIIGQDVTGDAPAIVAPVDVKAPSLPASPIPSAGLMDDLVSELGWMADVIRSKH